MAELTFAPEELTPWERAKHSREQALGVHRQVQQAGKEFDFNRFVREFAEPLVESYNTEARTKGLPLANRKWFELLRSIEGHAAKPKDFYIKHRARIQPKMFPGDPAKAAKAYDLFISKLSNLPLVTSGPVSGILSHEFGHGQTYVADPDIPIAATRPSGSTTTAGKEVERLINEAVASYRGFQTSWKVWERHGIPHKAWSAWYGFPTYLANVDENQFIEAMRRLRTMEGKYPGISDQVQKVLHEYDKYVEPVMYNIPGKDWTADEKEALKRFLKTRGAPYRESVPEEKVRLKHLRQQPYVMTEPVKKPSTIATSTFLLSKRGKFQLSSRLPQ